jgi:hypothetical protein
VLPAVKETGVDLGLKSSLIRVSWIRHRFHGYPNRHSITIKIHHTVQKKCKIAKDSSRTANLVASFHVHFSSGNYRLGSYWSNAGRIGWVFARGTYQTQQILPVQKHVTLKWLPATNVLAADVFVTGIFIDILCHTKASNRAPPLSFVFQHVIEQHVSRHVKWTVYPIHKVATYIR